MHFCKGHRLVLILLLGASTLRSQDTLNSAYVERHSYELYVQKNWKELIPFVNKAISKNIDYYYLRMRLGIAYYEKQNYLIAEKHFRKALEFNSGDDLAKEYLYYCRVYTGRYEAARASSRSFDELLAKKVGRDSLPKIGFVIVEGGTKISDSSRIFKPARYAQIGLGHYVNNRFSLFHAFTYFAQQEGAGSTVQFQYYLKASVPLKNSWLISPSAQWINKKFTATVMIPPRQHSGQGPPPKPLPGSGKITRSDYFIGSLAIEKTISKWDLSLINTITNIDSTLHLQHGGSVAYSVFGNNKLILGCSAYIHTNNKYTSTYTAVSPFISLMAGKRISLTGCYFMNSGNNIIEGNGYIVNNSSDLTTSRWSALAEIKLSRHINIYGLYQFENKQQFAKAFNYHYNVIAAGIKIIP